MQGRKVHSQKTTMRPAASSVSQVQLLTEMGLSLMVFLSETSDQV
jgi:hypothetical protein